MFACSFCPPHSNVIFPEAVLSALPDATLVRVKALALGRFCTSLGFFCGAAKYGALALAKVTGGDKQGTETQRQLSLIHKRQAVQAGFVEDTPTNTRPGRPSMKHI
ncbi:hypothetical protein EMIT0P4_300056 [Pseudomonas sp. IT-P4]